jgi:hypothetical protein
MALILAGAAAGAGVIGGLFGGGGTYLTINNRIVNDMTVRVAMESSTSCISQLEGSETFSIDSSKTSYYELTGPDSTCVLCQNVLSTVLADRQNLETTLQIMGVPFQTINPDFVRDYNNNESDLSPCALMCRDIVVQEVSQISKFSSDVSCQVSTTSNTEIQQSFKASIESHMKNQQDFFGKVLGSLYKLKSNITTDLANVMSAAISTRLQQNLVAEARVLQEISIGNAGGNSHSVYVNNVKQSFTLQQVGTMKVVNNIVDQLKQSAQFSILQQLTNKNDTIGGLSEAFVKFFKIWSVFIKNTIGQLFVIFIMLLIILLFYKSYQYTMTSAAMQKRNERIHDKINEDKEAAHKNEL